MVTSFRVFLEKFRCNRKMWTWVSAKTRVVFLLALYCLGMVLAYARSASDQSTIHIEHMEVHYVGSFSSAKDFGPKHPILDRTLDIVAGPADPSPVVDYLRMPVAVVRNSRGKVFVADPGANAVHVFDFAHSRYRVLDSEAGGAGRPVALAVDAADNLYLSDESSRTILIYDSTGKFRRRLGKLRGGEAYFDSPIGLAVDRSTGNLYVCDSRRNMVLVMDSQGRVIQRIGKRGGGDQPGDFRGPTQAVLSGGELFVLDTGNRRVQIFDARGHFRRATQLAYADEKSGLAVDAENVYLTNSVLREIQVYPRVANPAYEYPLHTADAGALADPTGLWITADQCLYVLDSGQPARVILFQIGAKDKGRCRERHHFGK